MRSSPFLLNTVISTHLKRNASNYPCVYELNLEHSFYVDDLFTGSYDVKHAIDNFASVIELMKNAGFLLHKFMANNAEVNHFITSLEGGACLGGGRDLPGIPLEEGGRLLGHQGGAMLSCSSQGQDNGGSPSSSPPPISSALGYEWKSLNDVISLSDNVVINFDLNSVTKHFFL